MFTQDLPYLLVRLVLLGTANLHLDRTIYLFLVKNMLLVYFDMYQIYYIYKKYNKDRMKCLTRVDMIQLVKNASGKTCLPPVDSEWNDTDVHSSNDRPGEFQCIICKRANQKNKIDVSFL